MGAVVAASTPVSSLQPGARAGSVPVPGQNINTSLYSYSEEPTNRPAMVSTPAGQPQPQSHNSSFSEEPVKLRQTGRQSGRFRKSSTMSSLADKQRSGSQRPNSSFSQQTNVA